MYAKKWLPIAITRFTHWHEWFVVVGGEGGGGWIGKCRERESPISQYLCVPAQCTAPKKNTSCYYIVSRGCERHDDSSGKEKEWAQMIDENNNDNNNKTGYTHETERNTFESNWNEKSKQESYR